ncbi:MULTISPECIES: glycoside hydrolase family 28 protein [unclassified Imperialibacter]|uniref:glycoside hydrolase family 28 protein n=1 Tax=unclassified Imperialibacter TaxID=2629706 RepID=UPI00125741BE|nr:MULTISPECIES: glycoside hydrolase family 28 protein [unclassified Imperialibacter]CAD5257032.1 Glycoside hydrolase [Imperialibacter sp. 75]CAD5259914.1 Glycoside hydrolase [Imperialibacter sp. 89]VVT25958.1 Glycoside hydrolase [Imperialibacter sp. EC-SDR9]
MKVKLFILCLLVSQLSFGQAEVSFPQVEFDMPKMTEPVIPNYRVSLLDFGGMPDGATLNTDAFAKAIEAIVSKGGGHLVVPRGIWLTGPITLKSNLNLHVEEGALILFSDDKTLYPIVATSFEGLDTYRCISPINALEVENISITGKGVIDGNGDAWRLVKRSKVSSQQWKEIVAGGGLVNDDGDTWYPSESFQKGVEATSNFNVPDNASMDELKEYKDFLRPVMISIRNSRNVMLDGPTFQNSPAWNIHPLMCENLIVRNLTVRNPWYSQNGDGIDIESCKNTWVYNNSFDVGDDAICIKSGKDVDGRKRGIPTENLVVFNNIVYHGHGGFTVGSEMSGGVKNVHVSKCTFIGTDCGLRFKSTRGRGGVVENVYITDIDMYDIAAEPIRFNLFYGGQSPILEDDQEAPEIDDTPVPVTEETPSFKDIYMKNIRSVNSGVTGFFQGLPEMNLKNVNLDNVYLSGKKGVSVIDADGMSFKDVTVVVTEGNPFTIYNSHNLTFSGFKVVSGEGKPLSIQGAKTNHLTFLKADFSSPAKQMLIGEGVDSKAVKMK